ncbi:sugar ABC transporter substrate-binding protein [Streptomyces sp. NPDC002490]|uniref:ABC transporter substrate-binding protein n=1 Tax=Streptomyces sp. NPDC002490 TaxID=3154416 RepID=UPI003319C2C2
MPVLRTSKSLSLVAIAGALALTTACGAGSKAAGGDLKAVECDIPPKTSATVNVLAYNSSATDPFTNAMVKSCSKNGVTVRHAPIDFSGQYQKTATTLAGNQGTYDIIEMYSGAVPRYASTDKLLALDSLFAKYKDEYRLGEIDETMLKGLSYDGKLYALPTQANVGVLVYRKDVFDELGLQPPKTYAELKSSAEKIKQSGQVKHPIALPFADSTSTLFEQTMASQGLSYVDSGTGEVTFGSPQAKKGVEALTALKPYMDPQVLAFDQPRVQQQLFNGKAAIGIMYSGRMADLSNPKFTTHADKFAFASPPAVEPGGKPGSLVSVDGWSIPKNSKIDPDLLFRMMAASISPAASRQAVPAAYPARTGVVSDGTAPYTAAVRHALDNGAVTPPAETWLGNMQNATSPLLQKAFSGKASVESVLRQCQKAGTAALKGS